ncbi:hypothetical protein V491_00539 [Pseudogymnoascus sp. VKM F-3775]|nr:hypothetical protein V491_00539 [Pseudogymnoascus sp. VKM F-3775]
MARTKQTARPSTVGRAPRIRLASSRRGSYRFKYGNLPLQHLSTSKKPVIPDTTVDSNAEIASDAQMKVFSTPEVLVIILSQLPHSSLLKAKLVNKTWTSVFENPEIQASLFERPRPKNSALYTETYSDLLMNRFATPWPTNGEEYESKNLTWQWRQLLVCQPPVEALEIVQEIGRRANNTLEFRTVIPRPNGLRMGVLYDAIKYWHQVERSSVELLWNRKTGDLTSYAQYYPDGPSFKTSDDKPCVTIWGNTSVGCGQYGGLTYDLYQPDRPETQKSKLRVIRSGDEKVVFAMSEPKVVSLDLGLICAARNTAEEDEEGGDGGDEGYEDSQAGPA